jgi:Cft2 family RNA processing exonuclease
LSTSDHADTPELLEWLRTFSQTPSTTYLVHGRTRCIIPASRHADKRAGLERASGGWMEAVEADNCRIVGFELQIFSSTPN